MKDDGLLKKLKEMLSSAKNEIQDLGGRASFKSGEWFLKLIAKSFESYFKNADEQYFRNKYKNKGNDFIAKKMISVASKNASLVGALTGAAVSADELVAISTGGEVGIGLPANITIGISAVLAEAVVLVRIQLKLIAELSKIYSVELNPDDPEDILLIFAFAVRGSVAEAVGKAGMKIGKRIAENAIKNNIKKDVLKTLQKIGLKLGIKILQRNIIKYTLPVVSVGIGIGWNYSTTKRIGKIATKHFIKLKEE